jgi:hypothetical protein
MKPSAPPNASRHVSGAELVELALLLAGFVVLTALGTWGSAYVGVPPGWRLAAGVLFAIPIVGAARLAHRREAPTWRWFAALLALWGMVVLKNLSVDIRFW